MFALRLKETGTVGSWALFLKQVVTPEDWETMGLGGEASASDQHD